MNYKKLKVGDMIKIRFKERIGKMKHKTQLRFVPDTNYIFYGMINMIDLDVIEIDLGFCFMRFYVSDVIIKKIYMDALK